MERRKLGFLALLLTLMWVLAAAVPSEAGRYHRHYGHRHWGYRPYVSFYAPFYPPYYYGSYYRPYYSPYYYRPYYAYPYYGVPVAYGWPFFWPGLSFYFRF